MPMQSKPPQSKLKTFLRVVTWAGITCLVLILGMLAFLFIPVIPDPAPGFQVRKGSLQHVEITRTWTSATAEFSEVTLTASSGLQAQLTVSRPAGVKEARPLVILMGGYRTGRHAAELIKDSHGIVLASIAYPYHGNEARDDLGFLRNVTAMREAVLDTPPVVLLVLDYLAAQDYVDKSRIELAGVSFGAFLASVPGALDQRFRRVWLIHGAGDPAAVFDHFTVNKIKSRPLRWLLTRGFALLIQAHHMKPERWVGKISPRPVMIVHARNDISFPKQSIDALHVALQEPYEIIWLGKEHIGAGSQEIIQQLTDLIYQHISQDRLDK